MIVQLTFVGIIVSSKAGRIFVADLKTLDWRGVPEDLVSCDSPRRSQTPRNFSKPASLTD